MLLSILRSFIISLFRTISFITSMPNCFFSYIPCQNLISNFPFWRAFFPTCFVRSSCPYHPFPMLFYVPKARGVSIFPFGPLLLVCSIRSIWPVGAQTAKVAKAVAAPAAAPADAGVVVGVGVGVGAGVGVLTLLLLLQPRPLQTTTTAVLPVIN